MPYVILLVYIQAFGAIVGVGSAVRAELAYVRAMRDGRVSEAERHHLDAIAHGLKYGMTVLLLASLGLVVASYLAGAAVQPALTSGYWSFVALALLVIFLAWALSRQHVSFTIGSAAIFTGWWFLLYLALGRFPLGSFGATAFFFLVATAVFYGILQLVRHLMTPRERAALDIV